MDWLPGLSRQWRRYNSWAVKINYSNFAGEQMLKVFVDTTTGQQWDTFYQYDNQGRVLLTANPSAVTDYNDSYADLRIWAATVRRAAGSWSGC